MAKRQLKKQPTAIELFKKFQSRYREIAWEPCGLMTGKSPNRFYFSPESRGEYATYQPSYLNVKEYGLTFPFNFDPAKEEDLVQQLLGAIWSAITAGPFANRHFYADPWMPDVERTFRQITEHSLGFRHIKIIYSHDGEAIEGLGLARHNSAMGWELFVPRLSPEGIAIDAALQLEHAMAIHKDPRKYPGATLLRSLLDVALANVPD